MKKDTKVSSAKNSTEFLLRFSWSAIYYATQGQPTIIDRSLDSLSLEEMKEKMKNLNWALEGGPFIRFRKLRDEWIKSCNQLIKSQNG